MMDSSFVNVNKDWQLGKIVYEDYRINACFSKYMKIPGLLHHIWLGSPLPEFCVRLRTTWVTNNSTWVFILWTDNEENFQYGYVVKDFKDLHKLLIEGAKKDIVFDIRNFALVNQGA